MTQIDFYIIGNSSIAGGELFACKLADKAYHLNHSIYIHTDDQPQAEHLDTLLWTFNPGSFLPHTINSPDLKTQNNPPSPTPILIGYNDSATNYHEVLINLAVEVPVFFGQFERVAEIVWGDENKRGAARNRYKFYRDRGYTLNTHNLSD